MRDLGADKTEMALTIVWPPEMAVSERQPIRVIVATLGNVAEARLRAAAIAPPRVTLAITTADAASSFGGSGHYQRLPDGGARIVVALGDTVARDLDGLVMTIAHEWAHLVVDFMRTWPARADRLDALADSVLDEYLTERMGWAIIGDVPVPARVATLTRLRRARFDGARAQIERMSETLAGPAQTFTTLERSLYFLAYALGAQAAGEPMESDAVWPAGVIAAVARGIRALEPGFDDDMTVAAVRVPNASAIRAVLASFGPGLRRE